MIWREFGASSRREKMVGYGPIFGAHEHRASPTEAGRGLLLWHLQDQATKWPVTVTYEKQKVGVIQYFETA